MKQLANGFMMDIESELDDIMELIDTLRDKIRGAHVYDAGQGQIAVKF